MSDAMVSVLDALDDPRALQGIRDEVLEMDVHEYVEKKIR